MNVGNVLTTPNIDYGTRISKGDKSSTAEFSIHNIKEQKSEISDVGNAHLRVKDRAFVNDVCRTDENAYKHEWDNFKEKYDRNINTWKDALQETIDFNRYVKENKSTADYVFQQHRDQVLESLERTKDVILKIFD